MFVERRILIEIKTVALIHLAEPVYSAAIERLKEKIATPRTTRV